MTDMFLSNSDSSSVDISMSELEIDKVDTIKFERDGAAEYTAVLVTVDIAQVLVLLDTM